jgi:ribosomal protein L3
LLCKEELAEAIASEVANMIRATVLLVTVIAFTPATVLAQEEKQSTDDLTVTTGQKLDSEKLLRIRINQAIQKFNTDVEQALRETQKLKQFSTPYLVEFQRRNQDIQRRPDIPRL